MRSLRTTGILIQRQLADNLPFSVSMLSLSVIFALTLVVCSFVHPHDTTLPIVLIIFILPALIGLTVFGFGILQTWRDRERGITSMLSTFTPRWQIVLARLVGGLLSILGVCIVLGAIIGGAILGGLIRRPETLISHRLVELGIGSLVIALACCSLGLVVARDGSKPFASLIAAPLAVVLVSLLIAKGFGRPLWAVLIPFAVVSSLYVFVAARYRRLAVVTSWLIVLMLTVIPLYWIRCLAGVTTSLALLEGGEEVSIACRYDFRPESRARRLTEPFTARSWIGYDQFPVSGRDLHFLVEPLGIVSFVRGNPVPFYFENETGLFTSTNPLGLRAGSLGVAESAEDSVGAFELPVVCAVGASGSILVVFERSERRFYTIRWWDGQVHRGAQLTDPNVQPIDRLFSAVGEHVMSRHSWYPRLEGQAPYNSGPNVRYIPLVHKSGGISVLDMETGDILEDAGYLPGIAMLFGEESTTTPRESLDWDAEIITRTSDGTYAGIIVASLSRQGTSMSLAVFSRQGRCVQQTTTWPDPITLRVLQSAEYVLQTPLPPVLSVVSFLAAHSFDAPATYRTVFLWPNSVVALQRDRDAGLAIQLLWALLCLAPSLVLSGFLTWRVVRDATVVGLPARSRWIWFLAMLAFGLPTYIRYRLARPKATLAYCAACGHLRRLDLDRCHGCQRPWELPHLDAPAWRIVSEPSA